MTNENEQGRKGYTRKGEPFYLVELRKLRKNGNLTLIARQIGASGLNSDIVAEHPVTTIDPVERGYKIQVSRPSFSGLSWNFNNLEEIMHRIEEGKEGTVEKLEQDEKINALGTGLDWVGRVHVLAQKKRGCIILADFYHIQINSEINYLEVGRK